MVKQSDSIIQILVDLDNIHTLLKLHPSASSHSHKDDIEI